MRIEVITPISAPIERCFDLSRSIDLHVASTHGTGEKAIAGVTAGLIGLGETVTWKGRHFGLMLRHKSLITEFDRPRYFQDSMLRGAFHSYTHEHYFEEGARGTVMTDVMEFVAPLGLFGKLVAALVLEKHLRGFLEHRMTLCGKLLSRISGGATSLWGSRLALRLYHRAMDDGSTPDVAAKVLSHLRRRPWLKPGDRLGVAVSGGADSVALLRAMLELRSELGIVLSVVHYNHTLRGEESEADHAFVGDLAAQHGLQLHDARGDVARRAQEHSLSIEAAARQARYEFFWSLIETGRLDKIATAHTLDDQAETVLLRLIRGTGTRGLGGIHPELTGPVPADRASQSQSSRGVIIRPLLHTRRRDIESYLASLGQAWREDSSNRDLRHTRNRVRQSLIPLLEKDFNPEITERLANFAEIALAEEDYWESELRRLPTPNLFHVKTLLTLPLALRRRLVRAAAPAGLELEFRQVDSILEVADGRGNALTTCNLHSGWTFQRQGDSLAFVPAKPQERAPEGLPGPILNALRLPIPGEVSDLGTGRRFQARRILLASPPAGYNPEHLYAPHVLSSELIVRTWRFGDRFWPAHTKAPKKLKELFQEKKIAAELRPSWPVMVATTDGRDGHEDIVWAQGLPAPAHLRPQPSDGEAILLLEIASRTK